MNPSPLLTLFRRPWRDASFAFVDTETTGLIPGVDGVCQVGIARFEDGRYVAGRSWLVDPGRPIPPEATIVHGITDEVVHGAPTLGHVLASSEAVELMEGAQPGGYNTGFDRSMLPHGFGGTEGSWPWADCLTLVRTVDRFARGKGRHRLEVSCERHGIALPKAHDAGADAKAAGELFFRLMGELQENGTEVETLGDLLAWLEERRIDEWHRFTDWLSQQPPMPVAPS